MGDFNKWSDASPQQQTMTRDTYLKHERRRKRREWVKRVIFWMAFCTAAALAVRWIMRL